MSLIMVWKVTEFFQLERKRMAFEGFLDVTFMAVQIYVLVAILSMIPYNKPIRR